MPSFLATSRMLRFSTPCSAITSRAAWTQASFRSNALALSWDTIRRTSLGASVIPGGKIAGHSLHGLAYDGYARPSWRNRPGYYGPRAVEV